MSLLIRELERQERRVLGALRCVDATTGVAMGCPSLDFLRVAADF